MYYFLKKKDFNLDKYDIDVVVKPHLTKKEQDLFVFLLNRYKVKNEYSEIALEKFNLPKEKLITLLNSISKKNITITIIQDSKIISHIVFNFFNFFVIEGNNFIYKFTREIDLSYSNGNLYNRCNLLGLLKYKSPYTYDFYRHFIKIVPTEKRIKKVLSILELKKILKIPEDKYTRFYDFEAKVLKPLIKDFEDFGIYHFSISYDKIKSKEGKGNRIDHIQFNVTNAYFIEVNQDTNTLLKEYYEYIDDFSYAYNTIYNYRKMFTFDETKAYIENNLNDIFNEK